jgi:beta-1,4-glucosyltransferase
MDENRHPATGPAGLHAPVAHPAPAFVHGGHEASLPVSQLPLAGYPIVSTSAERLGAMLKSRLAGSRKTVLAFANTNFVLKCQTLQTWIASEEVILVNDGIGLDIAALIKHGHRYQANLNGTDFVPYFLKNQPVRRRLFLFGGKPGVAEKAGVAIARDTGQRIVGCLNGYTQLSPEAITQIINQSGAEIVLVALGNPIQEEWMRRNMKGLNASLFIGVGALFDFLSGKARRAPNWVRRIRCEWFYRLCQEPRRLIRRYTVDIGSFLYLCLSSPGESAKSDTLVAG